MRTAAAVGTLLMVPFLLIYWAFITTPVINIHVLNGFFWRGLLTGCISKLGWGILVVAAFSYVARIFGFSNNPGCGRFVMNFNFLYPVGVFVYVMMLVAYGSNLNAAVVGACLAVLAAVWWYMMPSSGAGIEDLGMWDQTQRNLSLLPCIMAATMFLGVGAAMQGTSSLNLGFMMLMCEAFAYLGGIVFWGYGFDMIRGMALRVWWVFAVVTTLFVFLNNLGYMLSLTTLTVCMCNLTGMGGFTYFAVWMLFHSDGAEMATTSAFFTLYGFAKLLVTFFVCFFAPTSILPVVLLAVLVLATIAVTM
jgi:hypothetical protein